MGAITLQFGAMPAPDAHLTQVSTSDLEMGKPVPQSRRQEWILTRDHFKNLATLCDMAVCRSTRVMEQLGYSSDETPPEQSTH